MRDSTDNTERLLAYLEDALTPPEREAVEADLAASPALREELDELRALCRDLAALGETSARPPMSVAEAAMRATGEMAAIEDEAGELSPAEAAALRDALGRDKVLADWRAWYVAAAAELRALGEAVARRAAAAPVHLAEAVTARAAELDEAGDGADEDKALEAQLNALGAAADARMPQVDLRERVLDTVFGAATDDAERRHGGHRLKGKPIIWWVAAAACVVVSALVWSRFGPGATDPREKAQPGRMAQAPAGEASAPREPGAEAPAEHELPLPEARSQRLAAEPEERAKEETSFATTAGRDLAELTPGEVLAARKKAARDPAFLEELRGWTQLTEEQAETALEEGASAPEDVAGLARMLPPPAAERRLLEVVGSMPEEPYPRLALAKSAWRSAEPARPVASYLSELRELDPDNALPYYLEARMLLERGDVPGAMALMEQAAGLESASAYGLESAQMSVEALEAAGMRRDTAELLTAFTAGSDQYDMVTGLAEDLLAYGDHYFETGDSQTATRLYEATRRMGEQVAGGADLARERQAGLDIQYASVEALAQAVGSDANQGRIDELTAASLDLTAGYEELRAIFETVNDLLFGENSLDFWDVVSEAILSGGDLNLLESLDLESI